MSDPLVQYRKAQASRYADSRSMANVVTRTPVELHPELPSLIHKKPILISREIKPLFRPTATVTSGQSFIRSERQETESHMPTFDRRGSVDTAHNIGQYMADNIVKEATVRGHGILKDHPLQVESKDLQSTSSPNDRTDVYEVIDEIKDQVIAMSDLPVPKVHRLVAAKDYSDDSSTGWMLGVFFLFILLALINQSR